jgi:beta-phosphoglucomutase-like phosphatase (HAD superfamily)
VKLEALIFDVDGTLADTEETHRSAFNQAFEDFGLDWNWSRPAYARLLATTGGKERIAAHIRSLRLTPVEQLSLLEQIAAIHARKTEIYAALVLAGQAPLRDGVLRLIDEAGAANIRLAIASTTTHANIEALLHANVGPGALERFAAVGAGDMAIHKKPAPDIYEFVLRRLDVAAAHCVAIEDSANGLQAAKRAGLCTIVTPSYWTRNEDFAGADLVVPSLGSVLGLEEIERNLPGLKRVWPLCPNNVMGES